MTADPTAEASLFAVEQPPPVTLADRFLIPPLSVLDRRAGTWRERRRRWQSLGIQSELGRDARAVNFADHRTDFLARLMRGEEPGGMTLAADGVSIFDPVLCELAYRWYSLPGDRVLDPFAGGSVRGLVASTLGRWYTGVDLRSEQVAANEAQADLGSDLTPEWITGDSKHLDDLLDQTFECDLIFSCPPYGDLERYSDHPADLSTMDHPAFLDAYRQIIRNAAHRLRSDRFACWVVSDIRDRRGAYRGLVADTVDAFRSAGLILHNDAVILDQVGAAAVRAGRIFSASRRLTRVHQHLLVFLRGDARRATKRLTS